MLRSFKSKTSLRGELTRLQALTPSEAEVELAAIVIETSRQMDEETKKLESSMNESTLNLFRRLSNES